MLSLPLLLFKHSRLPQSLLFKQTSPDNLVFEPFGFVELVQLPLDETGHSKGFGFVQVILIWPSGRCKECIEFEWTAGDWGLSNQDTNGCCCLSFVSTVTDQGVLQDFGTNASAADLDDDDGGGLSLNSSSRALFMAKLDCSGTASSIDGSVGMPAKNSTGLTASIAPILGVAPSLPSLVPSTIPTSISTILGLPGGLQLPTNGIPVIDTIGSPNECLLLHNMFDPTLETEPEFDLDIKEMNEVFTWLTARLGLEG
ncbi:RNA-binding 39 [Gossypium australe]|uniref:RNA-binding 39 n=1 Tax=Gossypium australe TaxID=47621 RepID=A0A5B6VMB3_9ROSI|nr:RNA-binding 39 [Gossypium australe]